MKKETSCKSGGQKIRGIYSANIDLVKAGRKLEDEEQAEAGWTRPKDSDLLYVLWNLPARRIVGFKGCWISVHYRHCQE